jgi:glyoxylate reductase
VTAPTARVLVTHRLPGPAGHALPPTWEVWEGEGAIPPPRLAERMPDLDGLLCMLVDQIDADLLGRGPHLRVVSQMAVGLDNVDVDAATARGIPVGHTPDLLTDTTADTAFALLAAVVRRVPEGQDALRRGAVGAWDPAFLLGGDLHHTTLGIVGFGRIGRAVAERAAGFSMRVLYSGPAPKPAAEALGARHVPLDTLLSSAHAVVLTAPLTGRTRHMIDAGALARMRDGAVLVNVARGGLVDHDALVAETATGRISAGLDVTEPEPLPADHPLLAMPNVVVIPHLGSASHTTRAAMAELAVENLVAGLEGRPLPACANPEVYD